MIVLSLLLVIAAAVCLFVGLFLVTESLTFIYLAIGLCVVSLVLLWLGTRSRRGDTPSAPSAPVYGGAAKAGGSTAPARAASAGSGTATADGQDLDALTDPSPAGSDGGVVRKTTARDRAAARVATEDAPPAPPADEPAEADATPEVATEDAAAGTSAAATARPTKKAATKKAATKKAATKKAATKKAATEKTATKKAATKKAATKKAAKKAVADVAPATSTTGAPARARLSEVPGVGPAKQDALLAHYGSLESIRAASVDDIVANVRGFGAALAQRVKDAL